MTSRQEERGVAMIEFALTALLLFTLTIFIMDGSRILWNYVTVAEAARVGARYAITHGSESPAPVGPGSYEALRTEVLEETFGLDPAHLTIDATWNPNNRPGSKATVSVTYETQPLTSFFWAGQTLSLQGQSTMVIQH